MLKFFTDLAAALDALRRHAVLFLLGVTIVALALLGRSWLDAHDAAARLQATLAAQQKTITDADQRQSTRDAQLTQTLAQIAAAKEKVQTPTQAATALTEAIPQLIAGEPGGQTLPSPITIELPSGTGGAKSGGTTQNSATTSTNPRASDNANAAPNNASAIANSDPNVAPATTTKYPWTSLKLELIKLGIGHVTQVPAKSDLENQEGSSSEWKGTTTGKNSPGVAITPSTTSASGNVAMQSASNAQTSSLPSTAANAQGILSSTLTQDNSATGTGASAQTGASSTQTNAAPPAIIRVPPADLKPLYDAVEDCEVCQAKLTAAQADLTDETAKFTAATAQRDAAISAARGTFWTRTRTAAKWIVIGAAAGAVLARYH